MRAAGSNAESSRARTVTGTGIEPIVARTVSQSALARTTTSGANVEIESVNGRTLGSELVLPANPLMNLTDESLVGFIDCTIYEETANFFEEAPDQLQDLPIATPRTRTASMVALAEPLQLDASRTATGSFAPVAAELGDDPVAASTSMPAFAPARQTSSIQPFAPPHHSSSLQPFTSPPTSSIQSITPLEHAVSPNIAAIGTPVPDHPYAARGELPYPYATGELPYPRATGELPYPTTSDVPRISGSMTAVSPETGARPVLLRPAGVPASLVSAHTVSGDIATAHAQSVGGNIATAYPQTFVPDIAEAPVVVWPAPGEHTTLLRGVRKRRVYLVAAIAALSAVLLVMIIVAATRSDGGEANAANAPNAPNAPSKPAHGTANAAKASSAATTAGPTPTTSATRTTAQVAASGTTMPSTATARSTAKTSAPTDRAPKVTPPKADGSPHKATAMADDVAGGRTHDAAGRGDPHGATDEATGTRDNHDAGDDSAPPPSGPPIVGTGPCRVVVTTTPAGSIVSVDGSVVGPSPLTVANACQRVRIDVAHPRYQAQARWVALAADKPASLDVTLPRPTHAVSVLTLPPGAEVKIDGRRAGTTPTVVQMMGFTSVDLTIEKAGYQTITKRVYSKLPQDRVFVKMAKKP